MGVEPKTPPPPPLGLPHTAPVAPPVRSTARDTDAGGSPTRSAFYLPPREGRAPAIEKPLSPSQIVEAIRKLFDVPVRTGRFHQRAFGIYKTQPQVIRTKVANDLATAAHELGHHIDFALLKDVPQDLYRGELERLGAETSRSGYSLEEKLAEGVAEYFRLRFADFEEAVRQAPTYHAAIERGLAQQPALKQALDRAQRLFTDYLAQDLATRGELRIDFTGTEKPEDGRSLVARLEQEWIDDYSDLRRMVEDLAGDGPIDVTASGYALARLARGYADKASGFLRFGVRDASGRFTTGASLEKALELVPGKRKQFAAYLTAKHALERNAVKKRSGMTNAEANAIIQKYDSPAFQQAAQLVYDFQDKILDYAVEGDVLSSDARRKFRETYQAHVPLFRVRRGGQGGKALGLEVTPSAFKRARGSGEDIINPLEGLVRQTHEIVKAVEHKRALYALVRQALATTGGGRYIEEVPPKMHREVLTGSDIQQMVNRAKGGIMGAELQIIDKMTGDEVPLNPSDQFERWGYATFQNSARDHVLALHIDGDLRVFQMDKAIFDALQLAGPGPASVLLGLYQKATNVLRQGATLALGFIVRNPIRDTFTAAVQSEYGFVPGVDTLRGLYEYLRKGELYQLYLHSKASQGAFFAQDRNELRNQVRRMKGESWRDVVTSPVQVLRALNPLERLRALAETSEHATRLGEFRRGLQKEGVTEEGLARAALAARNVTLDFQRAGSAGRELNQLKAFFNASVQGYDRMVRTFKKDPAGATMRATLAITLPSIVLWALNKDDDEYRELPEWERQVYWHVPLKEFGGTGWLKIPKPFELGLIFGTTFEKALDQITEKDPHAWKRLFTDDVHGDASSVPVAVLKDRARAMFLVLVPTAVLPVVEAMANYSTFRERSIVSPLEEKHLPPDQQYTRWTSDTAKQLGSWLHYSPAKIDHLISGYGAGLARDVVQSGETVSSMLRGGPAKPARGVQGLPLTGALYRQEAGGSAQTLVEFYQLRDALDRAKGGARADWKRGDEAGARARVARFPNIGELKPRIDRAAKELADKRKGLDAILEHPTMTAREKRDALDREYRAMLNIARRAMGKAPLPPLH